MMDYEDVAPTVCAVCGRPLAVQEPWQRRADGGWAHVDCALTQAECASVEFKEVTGEEKA